MPWIQLTLRTESERAERIGKALQTAGAIAVTFADAEDSPVLEPLPGETRIWPNTLVTALFNDGVDLAPLHQALSPHLTATEQHSWRVSELADQVWERIWLEHFKPARFGRRLWVCPHGENVAQQDAVVIHLDPGLAFGTGTHPTTAMCLAWLDGAILGGERIIDYGCGSGILAIAAAKLGANTIRATDIDPQALLATRQNAADNGVSDHIDTHPPGTLDSTPADIVLANILAGPLVELAPLLIDLVKPGGDLVLSGLLKDQRDAVKGAYLHDIDWRAEHAVDEWLCLHGVRKTRSA